MAVGVRTVDRNISRAAFERGQLYEILEDGTLVVQPEKHAEELIHCDLLLTGDSSSLQLAAGCTVLFCMPDGHSERGCVLGVVGTYTPKRASDKEGGVVDDTTVTLHNKVIEIRADSKLVLRCGEGTVSISEDGTVIIRGARILSRSKGINKIKGAAVQIN